MAVLKPTGNLAVVIENDFQFQWPRTMDHEDSHLPLLLDPGTRFVLATRPDGLPLLPAMGRPMTRCECAEVPFDDVARQVEQGEPLQSVADRTGCGQNCTACVDDLLRHLHARRACRRH